MLDWVSPLGVAMGTAWLSGLNLYAAVTVLGLLQRFHFAHLPGSLDYLGSGWVIGVAVVMYAIEFVADKVPVVDSAWDTVHTFIRIPAGAVLAASAFADFDPSVRMIAMLVGGSVALTSHGAKAATRLAANTSPEPFSNILLSLAEDAVAIGSSFVLAWWPVLMLIIVAFFLVIALWLAPKIYRGIRSLFRWRTQ